MGDAPTGGQLTMLRFGNLTTVRCRLSALCRFRSHAGTGSAPGPCVPGPIGAAMLGTEVRDEKQWALGQWP